MDRVLAIGASGGVGQALAQALAVRGAQVTAHRGESTGSTCGSSLHQDGFRGGVEGVFDPIFLTTAILAPAGCVPEKSLAALEGPALAEVMQVNAIGRALILRHAPRLLPRQGRSVLGVLSARVVSLGDNHLGGWYSYHPSKAALNQIVWSTAIDLARTHREAVVAALHPGTVAASLTRAYSPAHGKLKPEEAARRLLNVLNRLSPDQTGRFWDHEGHEVPW